MNHQAVILTVSLLLTGPRLAAAQPALPDIAVAVSDTTMTRMKSTWADYFGTHYARSPEGAGVGWNTVRSYGGPHVGIAEENPSAPSRQGPFTGRDVRFSLEDFRSPRGGKSAAKLIPELIEHRFTGIYIMTSIVRPTVGPFDQDRAYWAVRQIHEAFPRAREHLVWQMGNEVVSGHFDPKEVWNARGGGERARREGQRPKPGEKEDNFFGYDLDWKEDYYVNDYLAPAIEATERASRDVYGDPRAVRIALGSMNPYNEQNIRFLANVMNRTFDGRQAPTLAGEPVWKHIDLLTLHYMAGSARTIGTLQQYHDDYLKTGKIKGIWITEDHGHAGKGPVTILDRGLRFLAWVAKNDLSSVQARLCWWGEGAPEPGGSGTVATKMLGGFWAGRPFALSHREEEGGNLYCLIDAADANATRGLVAIVPGESGELACGKLIVALPSGNADKAWDARLLQFSAKQPPQIIPVTLTREGDSLVVPVNARMQGVGLLLFAADPATLPKPNQP